MTIALTDELILKLKSYKSENTVFNQYLNEDNCHNLRLYIGEMTKIGGKKVLLIGEAPGIDGCRYTGIPFTSGAAIRDIPHPLLISLKNNVRLSEIRSEKTATIVWNYLLDKNIVPFFWNSYPFHPHVSISNLENRSPSRQEKDAGIEFMNLISQIVKPDLICGLGRHGEQSAKKAFGDENVSYIRHPSRGGKAQFIHGMNQILF